MRIGILGGTFDPVHAGHLYLAKHALKRFHLDKVIFVPAYLPPHKKNIGLISAGDRYNMALLAVRNIKKINVSDFEVKRKKRSYSVETLRHLRKKYGPGAEIFFITGSDSLKDIGKWKSLDEILKLCRFVIVKRPGFGIEKAPQGFITMDIGAKDISSTEIRKRIKNAQPISKLVPRAIEGYIKKHKLYL